MSRSIILHLLQWNLKSIIKELPKIKEQGFNKILISSVQGTKDENNYEFWQLYQPLGLRIIDSKQIGAKEDLTNLCREANQYNIDIIVDIVLRHTAGVNTGELIPHEKVDKALTDNKYFWTNAPNCDNYYDRWKVYSLATGLPMLDYNNYDLQKIYINFIQELKNCGVKGLRLDQAKHYALKEEGSHFFENVFGRFKDMFIFGECIDTPKELLDKYIDNGINVYTDYNLPTDKSKAVIAIESHDTFHTFKNTRHMDSTMLIREWEFLLNNNRESSVMWYCRPFDNTCFSDEIRRINKLLK
ncbi:alpha-amylase family glycosyl hydrolase [Clostridium botulinum]|uniref:alpha-amylase family glycosyl hydrolase n=1 Tax=Clostridium botulinum TaxID=1491 RepID=UPI001C9B7309|nr:alpha-amylase family glycosyl hydrolase [Clostridium botulinum]MBY6838682.1 hypothetical protein [Clostridium botulinum]